MNRIKTISSLLALSLLPLSLLSCRKEAGVQTLAGTADITLGGYYDASGSLTTPVWEADTKASIMLVCEGNLQKAEARALLPGSASSHFLFNILADRTETTVVSWYPYDAEISLDGETVSLNIPSEQDGTEVPVLYDAVKANINAYEGCTFTLSPAGCEVYVDVAMGDYDLAGVEIRGNDNEMLSGTLRVNTADGSSEASVPYARTTLPKALDCRGASVRVPVYCAPAELSKGMTVTTTFADGHSATTVTDTPVTLAAGGKYITGKVAESESTVLTVCGDNQVFVINADLAKTSYKEGIIWEWDAKSAASVLGLVESKCDHLDDCKMVDNGTKVLLTSSYGWCVLLDYETKEVLFHTTQTPNAHSAEYIPGGYIAVATSDGATASHNSVQLYSVSRSENLLASAELTSGHGVVWNRKRNLLYAAGAQAIKVFELQGLESGKPQLNLKKTIKTPTSALHDLMAIDDNRLSVAGVKAYIFNIDTEVFEEMSLFSASTQVKSLNYNGETGELWYTDATVPEGNETWSSHKIRYSTDKDASSETRVITVDFDMYKVRVKQW